MPPINIWAVLAAGLSSMILGALWYSPVLFGNAWMRESGMTAEKAASANMAVTMSLAFLLSLLGAAVFAMFLGPTTTPVFGLSVGFAAGLCWVAGSYGINYLFERRSTKLFLINGGYHTVQYTLIGLILGAWR
jgi:hypothetical protein